MPEFPVVQSFVWTVVLTAVFVIGGVCAVVTAAKTVGSYTKNNDSLSADAWKTLIVGGLFSAAFLLGGIFALIGFGGRILQGFGLG